MHVIHLAAQPTPRGWAVEPADATVAAALGAFDAVDTSTAARPAVTVARTRGVEAGEAEGDQEAHGQEGRQEEEGARASQGREAQGDQEEG
ncbi:MAG: hypothetical protein WD598_05215, partial [Acidimicrobiia bacterium]